MKVFVLMFGFDYEGYDGYVRVFTSKELAEWEGKRICMDEDYDYYNVEEVEVED